MASWPAALSMPEKDERTQPDVEHIEARGPWMALRALNFLQEVNTFLLPPLFVLIVLDLLQGSPHVLWRHLWTGNLVICGSFFAEWLLGLLLARSRTAYLTNLWLLGDLLSSIPLSWALQTVRLARFARLLRLVKLLKLLRARRLRAPVARLLRPVGVALSVSLSGALALQALEPQTVSGIGEGMWWSIATITTVGYGDIAPVTPAGRTIGALLMLTGIGTFSYLAGVTSTVIFDAEEAALIESVKRMEAKLDRVLREQEPGE